MCVLGEKSISTGEKRRGRGHHLRLSQAQRNIIHGELWDINRESRPQGQDR